jgi:predicted transcriptional regulator
MPYITSVEEIGFERGVRSLILRVLKHKFGSIPDRTIDRIKSLSIPKIESLSKALLDFTSIEDLTTWLETHAG